MENAEFVEGFLLDRMIPGASARLRTLRHGPQMQQVILSRFHGPPNVCIESRYNSCEEGAISHKHA